ncbi:RNA polymerase sigma factor [Actinospica durhamensis]|nr:RNA polymerase sigma factor [Actinospica durhamensis]
MKEPFENVVTQHGATVLRVCRALLALHDAEDAWSETFLSAMRAYPGLPETANVEAWLVTIARRKAIDLLRASGRNPVPVEMLPETAAEGGPDGRGAPGASGLLGDPAAPGGPDGDVWEAVGRLPDKQRQAITFRYLGGMPYEEISAILGGSVQAARRAAADGMKNLRRNYPGARTKGAAR